MATKLPPKLSEDKRQQLMGILPPDMVDAATKVETEMDDAFNWANIQLAAGDIDNTQYEAFDRLMQNAYKYGKH